MATAPKEVLSGKCPLCKKEFSTYFCPNCGIPLSTNNNMRPEYKSFNEFQLCDKCYTKNPYKAKYCRNCGNKMHEWVDIGLSVLWSTKAMDYLYFWMDNKERISTPWPIDKDFKGKGKDVARERWGEEWRIPTKKEFEELIERCKWEKAIIPQFAKKVIWGSQRAFKITGPNGNSFFLPTSHNLDGTWESCGFWTSTECQDRPGYAYRFFYIQKDIPFLPEKEMNSIWLSTPLNELKIEDIPKAGAENIYPVADKKWQGEL